MTVREILLTGYYGAGNFGDDILMCISYRVLREFFPEAAIYLERAAHGRTYVLDMLDGVKLTDPARKHYDLIVHGGGGVFFDFAHYGLLTRLREAIIERIGWRRYLGWEDRLRRWLNKPRLSGKRRLGLGIGVGGYAPGSNALRQKLPALMQMDALWLRDMQSREHLARFESLMHAELIDGSDLAFLTGYWVPPLPQSPPRSDEEKPKLGIILRDYGFPAESYPALKHLLFELATHYQITGLLLDACDEQMASLLAAYELHAWRPEQMSLEDFCAQIQAQDVLLTSRAHGAICGACLGVPSVIVEIEPKLRHVHNMLKHSSELVSPEVLPQWGEAIDRVRTLPRERIAGDVLDNRARSQQALEKMALWLN